MTDTKLRIKCCDSYGWKCEDCGDPVPLWNICIEKIGRSSDKRMIHFKCFAQNRKHYNFCLSGAELQGFANMSEEQQKKIKKDLPALKLASKKKSSGKVNESFDVDPRSCFESTARIFTYEGKWYSKSWKQADKFFKIQVIEADDCFWLFSSEVETKDSTEKCTTEKTKYLSIVEACNKFNELKNQGRSRIRNHQGGSVDEHESKPSTNSFEEKKPEEKRAPTDNRKDLSTSTTIPPPPPLPPSITAPTLTSTAAQQDPQISAIKGDASIVDRAQNSNSSTKKASIDKFQEINSGKTLKKVLHQPDKKASTKMFETLKSTMPETPIKVVNSSDARSEAIKPLLSKKPDSKAAKTDNKGIIIANFSKVVIGITDRSTKVRNSSDDDEDENKKEDESVWDNDLDSDKKTK